MTEFTAKSSKAQHLKNESNDQNIEDVESNENTEKEELNMQIENTESTEQSTNSIEGTQSIEAQLEAEGLGVLDGAALLPGAPGGAEGQEVQSKALYLGTPVSSGDSEGMDVKDIAEATENEQAEEEEQAETLPETCPVLSGDDLDMISRIRELGGAATIPETATFAGADLDRITGGDFAHNGVAFYRTHQGYTLIALAGATESDFEKAANRAEAEKLEHNFEQSVHQAGFTASGIAQRLTNLGGSGSLAGVKNHLGALGFKRESVRPVLSELHQRGLIKVSVQGATPEVDERDTRTRFVTLAEASQDSLAKAAQRRAVDNTEIASRRATAADRAKKRGQDKGFAAPFVPFGGTVVNKEEQARALYIENAKARYYEADLAGIQSVTMKLAATETLAAYEETLYEAEPNGAEEFYKARVKGRILTGLSRYEVLTGARIVTVLFPKSGAEIVSLLGEGRELSPDLARSYSLFTTAVNELVSEGRVERTKQGLKLIAQSASTAKTSNTRKASKPQADRNAYADQAPEPERQSGPDAHGADKYAADMAGAHDHRQIASGPQAPSTRPAQRRRTAKGVAAAVRRSRKGESNRKGSKQSEEASSPEASLLKAQTNQAWNEARDLYMQLLDPAERLELYLQLEGEQRLERMVEGAEEPDELYRAAVTLKDEGRISSRKVEGSNLIFATEGVDRKELGGKLVEVMAAHSVMVPEGTALAARVDQARSTREQLPQPVAA
jgi:hypothetical protein